MVAARHELGSVSERHAMRALPSCPLRDDLRCYVAPVLTFDACAENLIADLDRPQWLAPTIGHGDRGLGMYTVCASMGAAPVGVDGPAERHHRLARHAIECRLGEDLVERHPGELGRLHRAHEVVQLREAGQRVGLLDAEFLPAPPHRSSRTYIRCIRKPQHQCSKLCSLIEATGPAAHVHRAPRDPISACLRERATSRHPSPKHPVPRHPTACPRAPRDPTRARAAPPPSGVAASGRGSR